ncbi:aminoglycoside 3'-phosphotransferase [Paenibacillus tuaregi]|uniref:aminoglycoside 3'-phosphotransferase n=1 Tax=Paenibacillus tuaregi TaxID=1816681 RepID=UPI0008391928|nr:aminoglycoside 3'-phosphotransferase [Paenibacillus tuaregi]
MNRTLVSWENIGTVPSSIRSYLKGAQFYDSSCSEQAQTLYIEGTERLFLKISKKGTLERERIMTDFLHSHKLAPQVIAFDSDKDKDYLLLEALDGEDCTAEIHRKHPDRLAGALGGYLRKLHELPLAGCPFPERTAELIGEMTDKGISADDLDKFGYIPEDRVVIHGDYCLPNVIIMDQFELQGFIDLGSGGIGDRHYDIYWGLWTLRYNFNTERLEDLFLDAYGRQDVDPDGLRYFAKLVELTD